MSPETPKCDAARTASAAIWLPLGRFGAVTPLSTQVPLTGLDEACPTCVPALPHWVVPTGTPWQYWVVEVDQVSPLPARAPRKASWSGASPAGSFVTVEEPHWEPQ